MGDNTSFRASLLSIPPVVWSVYLVEMAFAAASTLTGAILPNLISEFNLDFGQAGVVSAIQSLTSLPVMFVTGFLSDRVGAVRVLLIGLILLTACPVLMAIAPSYAFLILGTGALGVALGFIDPMTNAVLVERGGPRKGEILGLLHASYGLGAAIFPMVIAFALARGMSWRLSLAIITLFAASSTVLFHLHRDREANRHRNQVHQEPAPPRGAKVPEASPGSPAVATHHRQKPGALWRSPRIWTIIPAMFFYSGAYRNVVVWTVVYFKEILGTTQVVGSLALFALFMLIVVGRLISAKMSDSIDNLLLLTIYMVGAALGLLPVPWVNSPVSGFLAIAAFGLASAGIFPVITSYATGLFPGRSGTVTGLIYGSAAGGAIVLPWILGKIADSLGLRSGMLINAITMAMAGLLLLVLFIYQMIVRHNRTLQAVQID
ncbi:MAG TPA: MFS transporter [Firmicutes bacterium]|nr:MFS transporter [Bacillota bacterium]